MNEYFNNKVMEEFSYAIYLVKLLGKLRAR